jgi:hypothetical protein
VLEARLDYVPKVFMVVQTLPGAACGYLNLGLEGQLPEGAVVTNEALWRPQPARRRRSRRPGPPQYREHGADSSQCRSADGATDSINNLLVDVGLAGDTAGHLEHLPWRTGTQGCLIDYRGV